MGVGNDTQHPRGTHQQTILHITYEVKAFLAKHYETVHLSIKSIVFPINLLSYYLASFKFQENSMDHILEHGTQLEGLPNQQSTECRGLLQREHSTEHIQCSQKHPYIPQNTFYQRKISLQSRESNPEPLDQMAITDPIGRINHFN